MYLENKIQRSAAFFAPILLLSLLAVGGCDFSRSESAPPPTAPAEPQDPPGNNSVVSEQGDGSCPAAGPCIADFSVSLKSGETVSWVFSGAQPPTSTSQAGSVEWPRPGSSRWTSKVCNADFCSDAEGVVSFTAAE